MMRSITEVQYGQAVERWRPSRVVKDPCVICRTEYQAGEKCSVLPRLRKTRFAMDVDDLFDWLQWGVLVFAFSAMILVVLMLIFMGIAEAIYRFRRRGSKRPETLSIEQLLERIPDVPYRELPGAKGSSGGEDREDTCVICQAAYEDGEKCNLLPGCKHMFHKACIATWLRKRITCPLCRAMVVALPGQTQLNAAENMV
ncbi:hypothetical protein EJB05_29956, partial [Eragrostis curvula]